MRLLVIGALLLAACEDAVVIEVHTAPGIAADRVQLYIGLGRCADCPGIQPPLVPDILPGRVYYREDENPVVREARVEDGVATFRIEPGAGVDVLDLAVAVDANGQSAAIIQAVPLASAGRYRVDLLPANPKLGVKTAAPDGNFVAIWSNPRSPISCMGFERWQGGELQGERIFIVPETDLDCDGRGVAECAPYGFDAVGVPTLAETSCTALAPLEMAEVCKLGGPACDETTGTPRTCAPSNYCLPSGYCDLGNLACGPPEDRDRCLFDSFPSGDAVLDCTIPFEPASDQTHDDVCGDSQLAKFNIRQPGTTPATVACVGPDAELLLERPRPGKPIAFTDVIKYVTRDTGTERFVELRMARENGCNYKLEVKGEKAPLAIKPEPGQTFAQFWVTASGGGIRKVLVPIVLHYTNDCAQPATCTLTIDAEDSLARCLR